MLPSFGAPKGDEFLGKLGEISIVGTSSGSPTPKTNPGKVWKMPFFGTWIPNSKPSNPSTPFNGERGATNFGQVFHRSTTSTHVENQQTFGAKQGTWTSHSPERIKWGPGFFSADSDLKIVALKSSNYKLFKQSAKFQGCLIGDMLQIWDGRNDVQEIGKPGIPRENQVMPALPPLEPSQEVMNGWCAFQDLVVKFGKNIPKNESRKWLVVWKTASSSNYYNHPRKKYRKRQLAFLNCRSFSPLTNHGKIGGVFHPCISSLGSESILWRSQSNIMFYFARQRWLGQHLIISSEN